MTHVYHVESFRYIGFIHISSNTDEVYLNLFAAPRGRSSLGSVEAGQADNLAVLLLLG